MRILGIETSCDETAVCLMEASGLPAQAGDIGKDFQCRIVGNAVHSQAIAHSLYGGVFPNLAKREHIRNLVPVLEEALTQASGNSTPTFAKRSRGPDRSVGKTKNQNDNIELQKELKIILERELELYEKLSLFLGKTPKPDIDAIAVTVGPGLEPALWAGVNFARALSLAWNVPIVAVNHMEGHFIVSLLRHENRKSKIENRNWMQMHDMEFPALALLVSGGHTELVLIREWMKYEIIGETRDDAVGEAFDKVARLLGLPYPGGPPLSALAERARINADKKIPQINADKNRHKSASSQREFAFKLPRPMINDPSLDFSFAGLKTAVRRLIGSKSLNEQEKVSIAREFEDAAVEVLVEKSRRAAEEFGAHALVVGGGVSANKHLRGELKTMAEESGLELFISSPEFTGDNAVMIALAGYFHAVNREFASMENLGADGNLRLG